MNECLTQFFLSKPADVDYKKTFNNVCFTEENVTLMLNNTLGPTGWSSEVLQIISNNNDIKMSVALYLPKFVRCGVGNSINNVIYNIINELKNNVNVETQTISQPVEQPNTVSVASVNEKIANIKANIENNSTEDSMTPQGDSNDLFSDLMSGFNNIDTNKSEDNKEPVTEHVEFDSPESKEFEKEFWANIKQPTKEEVNPTGELTNHLWTVENAQTIMKWKDKHNITTKEQIDQWLIKYCGLDYDHFPPAWADRFIEWTNNFREQQTY